MLYNRSLLIICFIYGSVYMLIPNSSFVHLPQPPTATPFPFGKFVFYICESVLQIGASLVAQMVKRLPAMWETQLRFLGREDPLEKEMAIHSSTLAWKIPWTEEPDRL